MNLTTKVLLSCAFALGSAALLPAASISLDTVGADPDLTSPFFTFMVDAGGSYNATYRNVSSPPVDFYRLQLIAPFSPDYYNGPNGPKTVGSFCDGGHAFNACSITVLAASTTLVFDFFGIDATHPGLPYLREIGLQATLFDPTKSITGIGSVTPTSTPEPGSLALGTAGFLLAGLVIGRKQLLKRRIRA